MTNRQGTPIWYELMTADPAAAQAFYGKVMDWSFTAQLVGAERDYRTFNAADGEGVGGVMKAPIGASFAPVWAVYFGVDDVDATATRLKSLGGSVHMEPQDIPGVGRFAFVADPQGAFFYLMRGNSDADSTAFSMSKAGHCTWNELVTSDQAAALEFYSALFGWEKSGSMPMGEMGDYTFITSGRAEIGAMMNRQKADTMPYWNFAFHVPDLDVAKDALIAGGGIITHDMHPLPIGDDWMMQGTDPQGAKVIFTGARNQEAL